MDEWQALAELLVEVNLAIEDLDGWVTSPEDVQRLRELERLRMEIQAAAASRRVPRRLRRRLEGQGSQRFPGTAEIEPRD